MGYARKDVEKTKKIAKKFVRYQEGAELYSIGLTKFQELAKEAKAVYKIDKVALVKDVKNFLLYMLFLSQSLRLYCHAIIHKTEFSCPNERCGYIFLQQESKTLKIHRHYLNGRLLCSLRTNRKWCKRKGRSLRIQICFFVYTISDSILKNLSAKSP